jgi:hypothetical protein
VKRPVALLAVAMIVTHARPARAQETRACEQSLDAIRVTLDDDARRSRVWYWAWMAGGTALIASQGVIAGLTTGNLQRESILGSAASVFIPAFLLIHPPEILSDAPRLDARLALTTVDGHVGDPCVAVLRARELLARDARDEHFATAWWAHAFVIGGNIALGLILGVGFGDWLGFAKQAVGGTVIGEVQILTLPGVALQARGLGLGGSF